MALAYAGIRYELREVVLRNKPEELLRLSPKATVPVLVLEGVRVMEESLDILHWALNRSDPAGWLDLTPAEKDVATRWAEQNDGSFKQSLDRYKYSIRFPDASQEAYRNEALPFLNELDRALGSGPFLFGGVMRWIDVALFPFIRQFAHVDREWFDAAPYSNLRRWLDAHLESSLFKSVMKKYGAWQPGNEAIYFEPSA